MSGMSGMSERTVVRSAQCVALPDGLDDVTAAVIANPGISAWDAMKERAKLAAGETCAGERRYWHSQPPGSPDREIHGR
jgi:NADPH:quinone reductase-like Zn-dependent oxidoreductase